MINCMSAAISDLIAVAVRAAGASQPCSGAAPPSPRSQHPKKAPQPHAEIPAAAPSATRGGRHHPVGCSGLQEIAPGFCMGDGLLREQIPPPFPHSSSPSAASNKNCNLVEQSASAAGWALCSAA